jgi:SP family general alpha glucoside:H+ symporter-like MFS transporter
MVVISAEVLLMRLYSNLTSFSITMGKAEEAGVVADIPFDDVDLPAKTVFGEEALRATEIEHSMTFFEGVRLYPAAMGWSAFFSLGIIMTAFDPQLLGSLYAESAFQKDFGYLYEGSYVSFPVMDP